MIQYSDLFLLGADISLVGANVFSVGADLFSVGASHIFGGGDIFPVGVN